MSSTFYYIEFIRQIWEKMVIREWLKVGKMAKKKMGNHLENEVIAQMYVLFH